MSDSGDAPLKGVSGLFAATRMRCGDRLDEIYIAPGTSRAEAEKKIRSYAADHPFTYETDITGAHAYEMVELKWKLIAAGSRARESEKNTPLMRSTGEAAEVASDAGPAEARVAEVADRTIVKCVELDDFLAQWEICGTRYFSSNPAAYNEESSDWRRACRRREAASLRRAIARALRGKKAGGNEAATGAENGDN
jgi:hypothetical protein